MDGSEEGFTQWSLMVLQHINSTVALKAFPLINYHYERNYCKKV